MCRDDKVMFKNNKFMFVSFFLDLEVFLFVFDFVNVDD